jgi:hypothetical protein
MCLEKQGKYEEALADGATCISMEPQFVKGRCHPRLQRWRDVFAQYLQHYIIHFFGVKNAGYLCKATAEGKLAKYVDALKTLQAGQHIAPGKFDCAGRIPTHTTN